MIGLQESFGSRLEKAREDAGLSRDALASLVGELTEEEINPLTIRNYEKGFRWPRNPKTIEALGKALKKSWSFFFELEEKGPSIQDKQIALMLRIPTLDEEQLTELLSHLDRYEDIQGQIKSERAERKDQHRKKR